MENACLSLDEVNRYLDEVAAALPADIFKGLNGGIVLLPDTVVDTEEAGPLYTLGMYHYDPLGLGRYITIYYGSFEKLYGRQNIAVQKKALKDVLHHELTHHIESLAGVRDLEEQDEEDLRRYRRGP